MPSAPIGASTRPSVAAIDWGPLAVTDVPGGGPDARLGPGTLVIGSSCVVLQMTDARSVYLVWSGDITRWDSSHRRILYQRSGNGRAKLSDGDRVTLGGQFIPGPGSVEYHGEPEWLQPPSHTCPIDGWWVGDVEPA